MHPCRLAPDGAHLVAPANATPAAEECLLDVWKKDAGEPAGQIRLPGKVRWIEFVSPTRFAVLVVGKENTLEVWDAAERKRIHALPLKEPLEAPPGQRGAFPALAALPVYHPYFLAGAVSGGGRHVALGGSEGVAVFDVQEGRQLGRFVVPANYGLHGYSALSFVPERHELAAIYQPSVKGAAPVALLVWDLATGREKYRTDLNQPPGGRVLMAGEVLPGPTADTLLVTGRQPGWRMYAAGVIDPSTGNAVAALPYALLGPPVKGRALAFANLGTGRKLAPQALGAFKAPHDQLEVLFEVPFDAAQLAAGAAELMKVSAARPQARAGDRGKVAPAEPVPPKAWAAPPADAWPRPAGEQAVLPDWPSALADDVYAVVRYVPHQKPVIRNELVCERYSLATGKRLGEPQSLWPWLVNPATDPDAKRSGRVALAPPLPPAALTRDGARLAVVDPGQRHRVDIWDAAGKWQTGFYAAAPGQDIVWLGWSADGRLLSVAGGTLTARDAAAARAVFAVHGGYVGPCELTRGRQWGVFAAPGRLDVLDVLTGQCLGRCRAKGLPAKCETVRLSPDARRLLAVAKGDTVSPGHRYTGWVWDLDTGAAEQFPWTEVKHWVKELHGVGWVSPDQFILGNEGPALFDLKAKAQVTGVASFANRGLHADGHWFASLPDGRLWIHFQDGWKPLALPDKAAALAHPERQFVNLTRVPLTVEVDLGEPALSRQAGQKIADLLAGRGFTVGKGDWRLRLYWSHRQANQVLTSGGTEVKIPLVAFTWELVDPAGKSVWTLSESRGLLGNGSRYFKGTVRDNVIVGPGGIGGRTDRYDFGGQDPVKAATEEILEHKARNLNAVPETLPVWAVTTPSASAVLPFGGPWVVGGAKQ
jgi:hypothetical protein